MNPVVQSLTPRPHPTKHHFPTTDTFSPSLTPSNPGKDNIFSISLPDADYVIYGENGNKATSPSTSPSKEEKNNIFSNDHPKAARGEQHEVSD